MADLRQWYYLSRGSCCATVSVCFFLDIPIRTPPDATLSTTASSTTTVATTAYYLWHPRILFMHPLSPSSQQPPRLPQRPQRPPLVAGEMRLSAQTTQTQKAPPSSSLLLAMGDSSHEKQGNDYYQNHQRKNSDFVDLSLESFPVSSVVTSTIPASQSDITESVFNKEDKNKSSDNSDFFFLNKLTPLPNIMVIPPNSTDNNTKQSLQPLNISLPSITPLSSKNKKANNKDNDNDNESESDSENDKNIENVSDSSTNTSTSTENSIPYNTPSPISSAPVPTVSRKNSNTDEINNNKFYIQLLENVNLEDQNILFELVDSLVKVRSENENLKLGLWNKIDNLSTLNSKKNTSKKATSSIIHNSLLYDENLSNDQLKNLLDEQRQYNSILSQTIDEYQDSLEEIINSLVKSNNDIGNQVLGVIKSGEKVVEDNSDKMWDSWMNVVSTMQDISDFDNSIVEKMHGL